jgi:DNA-binding transcriptional ArsR family regulator
MLAPLDSRLAALADPTRRAILLRLVKGEATVLDIAAPFAMSQPAISHHLKVLERAGLILRRTDGTRHPCRLAPDALAPVEGWLAQFRDSMEANYQRLDDLLTQDPEEKDKP